MEKSCSDIWKIDKISTFAFDGRKSFGFGTKWGWVNVNTQLIEVDKSYFTFAYLANLLFSELFAHLNPIFVAADHHRREFRHPVCPLWVNWAEVCLVSCWKSFKPGEVTSASPSSLECCCLENRVVGLTLRVWEKSSNRPVAESVYVTDAIKNIYKSGVFRLRDAGGGAFNGRWRFLGGLAAGVSQTSFQPHIISHPEVKQFCHLWSKNEHAGHSW